MLVLPIKIIPRHCIFFQESVWKKLNLMFGKVSCSKLQARRISTGTQTTVTETETEAT